MEKRTKEEYQEAFPDYYTLTKVGEENGCCLLCEDAEEGCLCYDCKCKKCYWYIPPEEWNGENGKCRKTLKLNKRGKEIDTK